MKTMINQRHRWDTLKGDLVGGLITGIVALPMALAFGMASGLGATAGLYGAIATGIFAALFGGTPGQVTGPTGPITVVVASMVAQHPGHPELIFAAIILGGLLQIAFGAFRGGTLIHYIPYPVISGFMSGIGVIIILIQIPVLLGMTTPSSAVEGIQILGNVTDGLNPIALLMGVASIGAIYLLPKILHRIPPSIIVLFACTWITVAYGLAVRQIKDLGEIPAGLPGLQFPAVSFQDFTLILSAGFTLALLGSIDSLLTSVVVDKVTLKQHDSNRELLGQGIGNMISGLIGGLSGAGATMRSMVNVQNGGTTRLGGIIHGLMLLAVLLGLGPIASQIPLPCLAAILITVGISIIDYRGLKSIGRAPRDDTIAMLLVLGLTVFLDLITAVLVGLSVATFLFCKRFADLQMAQHGHLDSLHELNIAIDQIPDERLKRTYLYQFNGPLFFGKVYHFKRVLASLPKNIDTLILDFEGMDIVDQTGITALEDALNLLKKRGIHVLLVGISPSVQETFQKMHLLQKLPAENVYENLAASLAACRI